MFDEIYKNKTVLVTGHTGFQGGWLSLWLKQLGANVIGYSLEPSTESSFFESVGLRDDLQHVNGDIRNQEKFKQIISKYRPEIVFHLAADHGGRGYISSHPADVCSSFAVDHHEF